MAVVLGCFSMKDLFPVHGLPVCVVKVYFIQSTARPRLNLVVCEMCLIVHVSGQNISMGSLGGVLHP